MSRWTTPKSYLKRKDAAYVNMDDEYNHIMRAPRKTKSRQLQHFSRQDVSYESRNPYDLDYLIEASTRTSLSGEVESRDQVEEARFGFIEDSCGECFPFDESIKNDCTNILYSRDEHIPSPTKYLHTPKRAPRPKSLSTHDSSSHLKRPCTSQKRDETRYNPNCLDFAVIHTSSQAAIDVLSPPRVSRYSSTQSNFELSKHTAVQKDENNNKDLYPIQKREYRQKLSIKRPMRISQSTYYHKIVGPPSLNIHRLRLPDQYLHLLDKIVHGCEVHANGLVTGWNTELYSLTKQDIALREVPCLYHLSKPIVSYVKKMACIVYGVHGLICDENQPHVLKYTERHTGVELHHDKCDITINLMMSRSTNYEGGGTYFPDAHTNVRLEFGEFLLHPGEVVHGGTDIHRGSRILMVLFTDIKK